MEKKKARYYLNDYVEFQKVKDNFDTVKNEIENIKKKSKTLSAKKLLHLFVHNTIANLLVQSSFRFELLLPHNKTLENLNKSRIEMLDKLIQTRIDILLKKDEDVLIAYYDLVDDRLMEIAKGMRK